MGRPSSAFKNGLLTPTLLSRASGFSHDQSRLHVVLLSLSMRIIFEMFERIEERFCQLESWQSQSRQWRMDNIAHIDVIEPSNRYIIPDGEPHLDRRPNPTEWRPIVP